jgi:alcohol dehydrogenase (cytochrome c)
MGGDLMTKILLRVSLLTSILPLFCLAALPAGAADVTAERLANADKEPQNWLTHHRTYDGQRFSPLDQINRGSVKGLKLAYAVALGGNAQDENLEATPLVEDGFIYMVDQWGVVYKIDGRSGDVGRIVWRMDPGQEKAPHANRGVALWGNLVVAAANSPARLIGIDKESGKTVWETDLQDQPDVELTGASFAVKDKILMGAAGGDQGARDWLAGLDAKTGKLLWRHYTIPAPGEPGSETWKDKNNAWQTGGGALYVTGTYDAKTNQTIWGVGNPVPMYDARYRPGDNLFTNSAVSFDPDTGKMNWYFQYTPGDMWDYDEIGTHILFDAQVNGEMRTLLTHSGRNGFLYTMDRNNGQILGAKPYLARINWTKGVDPKTGKPVDYDPKADIQKYSGLAAMEVGGPAMPFCPVSSGGNNFWPSTYSPKTKLLYIPTIATCGEIKTDPSLSNKAKGWKGGAYKSNERWQSEVIAADPVTGKIVGKAEMPYAVYSGALSTAGGLVFVGFNDGTFAAFDDTTLEQVWKINVGSGFNAPPISFAVNGKQYVAIASGLSTIAKGKNASAPELKNQRNLPMLFVFSL